MKSISLAALIAAGIFAIYSAPSFAAATAPRGTPTPPCQVNCDPGGGDSTSPGDPWLPPPVGEEPPPEGGDTPPPDGDTPPPDGDIPPPGDDPNYPGMTKQEIAEYRACIARLDGLPQVSETQINQFGQPYKVTLKPICETQGGLTEVGNAFVENGNVYGLEGALKANALIKSKLGESQYKARDVVGIDFDATGNATLLVHKRRG